MVLGRGWEAGSPDSRLAVKCCVEPLANHKPVQTTSHYSGSSSTELGKSCHV